MAKKKNFNGKLGSIVEQLISDKNNKEKKKL